MLTPLPPRQTYTNSTTQHTFSYIHIPPTTGETILIFLHGFPSHSPDFIHQITYFSTLGFGILAPDLLGFGLSSAPLDPTSYTWKNMSSSLSSLITSTTHPTPSATSPAKPRLIGIGHDLGATLLSRLAAYHAELFSGLVFLSVGPNALGTPFDVVGINAMTREQTGSEMLGYVAWLGDLATGAQRACEENARSVMSVLFAKEQEEVWRTKFRPLGALKGVVKRGEVIEVAEWFGRELQMAHLDVFGRRDRGYVGVTRWYAMYMGQMYMEDEKGMEEVKLEVPCLFVGEKGMSGDMQVGFLKEWVPNLKVRQLDTGHWVHLEKKEVVNEEIETFLKEI